MPAAEHVRGGGGGGRRRRRARPHPAARETSRCVTTRGADEASHAVLEVDERFWLVRRRVEEAPAPRSDGVNVATCLYNRWRAVYSCYSVRVWARGQAGVFRVDELYTEDQFVRAPFETWMPTAPASAHAFTCMWFSRVPCEKVALGSWAKEGQPVAET